MDLAIRMPESIVEVIKRRFRKKTEDMVYREEKVIEKNSSLVQALSSIEKELDIELDGATLHIIDKFFSPNESIGTIDYCVGELFDWAVCRRISEIILHKNRKNEFVGKCIECFDGTISFSMENYEGDIHDRFWIVKNEGHCAGVMVGSSLSGIGKNFTVVCKISNEDLERLIDILHDYDIKI